MSVCLNAACFVQWTGTVFVIQNICKLLLKLREYSMLLAHTKAHHHLCRRRHHHHHRCTHSIFGVWNWGRSKQANEPEWKRERERIFRVLQCIKHQAQKNQIKCRSQQKSAKLLGEFTHTRAWMASVVVTASHWLQRHSSPQVPQSGTTLLD